jgi:hypothetical protein
MSSGRTNEKLWEEAKKEGMKKGIQYVPQPKKIVEKIKKIKKK